MTPSAHRSGNPRRESRFRVKCPHCHTFARARTSTRLTETYLEVRFECTNDACGFVWLAGVEALRSLCPSDMPNPEIQIPFSARHPAANSEPAEATAAAG